MPEFLVPFCKIDPWSVESAFSRLRACSRPVDNTAAGWQY